MAAMDGLPGIGLPGDRDVVPVKHRGSCDVRDTRKGEKNPGEGSEIDPETLCVQAVGADLFRDCVPFV